VNTATNYYGLDAQAIVCDIAVAVPVPDRIRISPWGEVESTSGSFIMDAQAAAEIIAAFAATKVDLPIDAEHATLGGTYASPSGDAPARGWIKSLYAIEGQGLFANVQWTELGAEYVRTKQYRYLSPVLLINKKSRRALVLHSVALTNKPAIVGMVPIVNSRTAIGPSERDRVIVGAARRWQSEGRPVQGLCGLDAFINLALIDAGLALLTNSERGRQPADFTGDRESIIANAAAEWEANKANPLMFASKGAWVNDTLRERGHSLLAEHERDGLVLVIHTDPDFKKPGGIAGSDSPRAETIRKLAKEWASLDHASRRLWTIDGYVGHHLPEGEPEVTLEERNELLALGADGAAQL
jgi:hypothetical protein